MCTNCNSFPNLIDLFHTCDNLCTKGYLKGPNNLLSYLAYSSAPTFNFDACFEDMFNRVQMSQDDRYLSQTYQFKDWESNIFKRRFKILSSNNKAYELAVKLNPTVQDLEAFSKIDPCFALLFPVKRYLMDHAETAVNYLGFLPFGREVTMCYNSIVPVNMVIKGHPTFKDHISLSEISLRKAILMGVPTVTINNIMYSIGKSMQNQNTTDEEE